MPPTLRLQRRFFRHWPRHGAFLCPTLWSGCLPRPTPLPWRPVQLSASVRHWKIGLMPVRRWKRCRGSPLISPCRAGEKHDLRKANVDRRRPAPQYAPRRLAGRNPVLALLPLGAGRGEGMAPARGGRAVLRQREHCKSSYESEREGRQSPPELRRKAPVKNL